MNASKKFLATSATVDQAAIAALPNSRKIYVQGSRADIQVPMREISQSDTPTGFGNEKNPPIFVYDCSGPYTDPTSQIDVRKGLVPVRQRWIEERQDTEVLPNLSSSYGSYADIGIRRIGQIHAIANAAPSNAQFAYVNAKLVYEP